MSVLELHLPPLVVQSNFHFKLALLQITSLEVCECTHYNLLAIAFNVLIGVLNFTMEFAECETRKCVSVNVANNLPDSSSTFIDVFLTRTANLNPRITLQPQAGSGLRFSNIYYFYTRYIFQTDYITVGYSLATYITTESQRRVEVTVVIQPPSRRAPRAFSLSTDTEDGTASIQTASF